MADARPLEVLRAEIDDLDRAVLAVLARRMTVVTEIAALKRSTGSALRDRARERALREDRARTAVSVGLPTELSDAVFRAVVRSSREHLGALGVRRDTGIAGRAAEGLIATLYRWAAWLEDR